jgi:CheY-like chemotaxis protein
VKTVALVLFDASVAGVAVAVVFSLMGAPRDVTGMFGIFAIGAALVLFALRGLFARIRAARNAAAAVARQAAALPAIEIEGSALLRNWSIPAPQRPAAAVAEPFSLWGPARIPRRPRNNRVLIIDDDPHVIQVTHRMLTRSGYTSEMALGGHEGMLRLATGDFGVVVIDYHCGGGDAPALIPEARRRNSSTYVILTSSAPNLPLLAQKTGADHSIAKPYEAPELSAAVACALAVSDDR